MQVGTVKLCKLLLWPALGAWGIFAAASLLAYGMFNHAFWAPLGDSDGIRVLILWAFHVGGLVAGWASGLHCYERY